MNTTVTFVDCDECFGLGKIYESEGGGHFCVNCDGAGKFPFEPGPLCSSCGEPSDTLQLVESYDSETGYRESADLCYDCRTEGRRRDAEEYGGLHPRALIMLGVDESWMTEGARPDIAQEAAPRKPVVRELGEATGFAEGTR